MPDPTRERLQLQRSARRERRRVRQWWHGTPDVEVVTSVIVLLILGVLVVGALVVIS